MISDITPTITRLRTGHRTNPLGTPTRAPHLSWTVEGAGEIDRTAGFTVTVGATEAAVIARDSSSWTVEGVAQPWTIYGGPALGSRESRFWNVRAVDATGAEILSETARFETGLASTSEWVGDWIAAPQSAFRRPTWDPSPLLRREFELDGAPENARVYATALGLYRLWVNGVELTEDALFRPGWSDYTVRVYHQTFDVSTLLRPGRNVVAASLAKGWYAGLLGLQRQPGYYGEQTALKLQLETPGAGAPIVSDTSWNWSHGAVLASDLLTGEIQDIRQAQPGWNTTDFDAANWSPVESIASAISIDPQPHDPVRKYREHEGTLVWQHARGPAIFDFGQNLVGFTRIQSRTLPRTDVIARHGEILTPDNLVYRDNLRGAFQEDRYTTGDAERHDLSTQFTIHGFRFAEVWGLPSDDPFGPLTIPADTTVTATSIDAGQETAGHFESSDARLNALASSVEWTVRDNFLEVITDCPQRDERLGWLGDAGVIGETAAYFFDIAAFVSKFMQDAEDSQGEDGTIRSYVPPVPPGDTRDGSPGWADGYVRLIHLLAVRYGDLETAGRHYDSMRRYLAFVDENNPSGIRTEAVGSDFGDWLSLAEDPNEPPHPGYAYTQARSTSRRDVVATAHTYRSYVQLGEIAQWLGDAAEAERCTQRAAEIAAAYRENFVDEDGRIAGDTQTAYAQAVGYGLLEGDQRAAAVLRLSEKLAEIGHVTTGIHGVEHILPVLADNGQADLAYSLLLKEDMPSWLHMVDAGGTTIWEKWDGLSSEGKLSTAEMNSFNHCALGAVGKFLFQGVAGIDATRSAWDGIVRIRPHYTRSLEWAGASYLSASGTIASRWRWDGEALVHEIEVPPLLVAEIAVPTGYTIEGDGIAPVISRGPGTHVLVFTPSAHAA